MKLSLALLFLIACSSRPQGLTEKAKDLEVFTQKPSQCSVVGKVVGKNNMGSKELAMNDAMNQVTDLGATGIRVDQEVPNGKIIEIHATGYDCN